MSRGRNQQSNCDVFYKIVRLVTFTKVLTWLYYERLYGDIYMECIKFKKARKWNTFTRQSFAWLRRFVPVHCKDLDRLRILENMLLYYIRQCGKQPNVHHWFRQYRNHLSLRYSLQGWCILELEKNMGPTKIPPFASVIKKDLLGYFLFKAFQPDCPNYTLPFMVDINDPFLMYCGMFCYTLSNPGL